MSRRELWTEIALFLLLISAVIASPAHAGRNAGGALVMHSSDMGSQYRLDFCSEWPLPATCEELDTQVDRAQGEEVIVWVVAAFPAGSSPGVTALQFGLYGDVTSYYMYFACPTGSIEASDDLWPQPGTGDVITFAAPVYDRLYKVYWFDIFSPPPGAILSTGPYPHGSMQAEFVDDSNPPEIDVCANFGTLRWGGPGENYCPDSVPSPGACCLPSAECTITHLLDCQDAGGNWLGEGTACDPFPCPIACCIPSGGCRMVTEAECAAAGGWPVAQGIGCDAYTCMGACCTGGDCTLTWYELCQGAGQDFMGPGTVCDAYICGTSGVEDDPSNPPVSKPSTWGRVKSLYR